MNVNLTTNIVNFVKKASELELNEELIEQVKKSYLDFLCVTIAGSQSEVSQQLFQYLKTTYEGNNASALGYNERLIHTHAAFINGTSAHALDFDDGYTKGSVHVGSVVFPAVLAIAEKENKSSEEILRAIIIGYEVTIRVAAIIHPYSREQGFHNTSIAGIFGATAAVCYLLNLDNKQIAGALGNALSFTGGTFAFLNSGSDIKRLHPGIASMNGIIAAEMAKSGIIGPDSVFERRFGLFDVFINGNFNEDLINQPLGDNFEILNMYIKSYPCCRQLDAVIGAIIQLKEDYPQLELSDITRIEVGVHHLATQHDQKECNNLLDAQLSIPFAVAIALLDSAITIKSFNINRSDKQIIEDIIEKVEVFEDKECENLYPKLRKAKVTVYSNANEEIKVSFDKTKGESSNPMTFDDVKTKFKTNCQAVLTKDEMLSMIEYVTELDFLGAVRMNKHIVNG